MLSVSQSRLWQTVLGEIELSVSRASYKTWFSNTCLLELDDTRALIGVPNIFTKKQMEDRYHTLIKTVLGKNEAEVERLEFKIHELAAADATKLDDSVVTLQPDTNSRAGAGGSTAAPSTRRSQTKLNDQYCFDNFIVGASNELAYAAAQAVTKHPGQKYNPLFIYGGSGLGKTHLMQAVGNELSTSKQTKSVVYVTSEQFVVEFLDYIRYKKKGFADKYRSADVLIVDDIQFIAGKERTEEEFFHTFNALHQSDKQIILSSDQPPNSIPTLEDRLRSRFSGGMIVDVQAPDFETRCAILQAKASEHDILLDQETVEYFATQIQSNIRELEGSLNQVLAFCELKAITPTIDVVRSMIGNRPTQPKRLTSNQVVERTAKYFELDLDEITGPKRNRSIVVPRQIAMYLLRSELHMSFPKVANALGRKDHTTAIHSVEKIEKNIHLDQQMNQDVKQIKDLLYA